MVAALGRSARTVEERTGVTSAQLFVLQQMERVPSLSISDIAALAFTRRSTASAILSRLERRGFVRRSRSRTDARRVMVSLTIEGRRLLRSAPAPPADQLVAALRTLDAKRLRALGPSLVRLSRALGATGDEPPMLFEPVPVDADGRVCDETADREEPPSHAPESPFHTMRPSSGRATTLGGRPTGKIIAS